MNLGPGTQPGPPSHGGIPPHEPFFMVVHAPNVHEVSARHTCGMAGTPWQGNRWSYEWMAEVPPYLLASCPGCPDVPEPQASSQKMVSLSPSCQEPSEGRRGCAALEAKEGGHSWGPRGQLGPSQRPVSAT